MIVNKQTLTTLNVAFNAAFAEGFGQAMADHEPFTMTVPSMTAEAEYGWLGHISSLREWVGERVLDGLVSHGYTIRNRTFESTVRVRREDIEDDNLGIYRPLFMELGRAAAAHPCELVYGALKGGFDTKCYDGQFFFDTDHPVAGASVSNDGGGAGDPWFLMDCSRMMKPIIHQRRQDYVLTSMDALDDEPVYMRREFLHGVDGRGNVGYGLWQLAYGSKEPLTATRYADAREAMLEFKSDAGRPLGIMPTHLVVSPGSEQVAREILMAERLANGATNVWRDSAQLIVSPWLA